MILRGFDRLVPRQREVSVLRGPDRPVAVLLELGRHDAADGHLRTIRVAELAAGRDLRLRRQVDRQIVGPSGDARKYRHPNQQP